MVTFSGTISTDKRGVVKDKKGGKGTIATKKAREEALKDRFAEQELIISKAEKINNSPRNQGLLDRLGIATLLSGNNSKDRNVTKPNQSYYGEPFKIGEIEGFTLEKGPFGLGTTLRGPKQMLPEFLQQNEGALLQSALNAQRYGSGNINLGGRDRTGNNLRGIISLENYDPPPTAQEFIDNTYQNPNSKAEEMLTNNMYFNALRNIGYAGVDENSGLYKTGVASALRNPTKNQGFFTALQSLINNRRN